MSKKILSCIIIVLFSNHVLATSPQLEFSRELCVWLKSHGLNKGDHNLVKYYRSSIEGGYKEDWWSNAVVQCDRKDKSPYFKLYQSSDTEQKYRDVNGGNNSLSCSRTKNIYLDISGSITIQEKNSSCSGTYSPPPPIEPYCYKVCTSRDSNNKCVEYTTKCDKPLPAKDFYADKPPQIDFYGTLESFTELSEKTAQATLLYSRYNHSGCYSNMPITVFLEVNPTDDPTLKKLDLHFSADPQDAEGMKCYDGKSYSIEMFSGGKGQVIRLKKGNFYVRSTLLAKTLSLGPETIMMFKDTKIQTSDINSVIDLNEDLQIGGKTFKKVQIVTPDIGVTDSPGYDFLKGNIGYITIQAF